MIEDRLYEAVQELPVPAVSFTAVKEEQRARKIAVDSNLSAQKNCRYIRPASSFWQAVL